MIPLSVELKRSQRFASAAAFDNFLLEPDGTLGQARTDDELDAYARANVGTAYHPTSTARMSAWNATDGVVNPDLTLKKAKGLRIVDASVLVSCLPGPGRVNNAKKISCMRSRSCRQRTRRLLCMPSLSVRQPSSRALGSSTI